MKFETHTLDNGMRVLLAPNPNATSVTVMIMTATGSRFENEEENGMAHFLEHMVFKGTKKRRSPRVVSGDIDKVGGQLNAFTAKDHTAYFAKVPKAHLKTALNVVSDIFLNPTFPKQELEKERGAVIEEINMYEDMPMRKVWTAADVTLFGGNHPMGRPILGPKKNILSFQRKDFVDYFNRNYVAKNSAICIAGAFSKAKALQESKKLFTQMRTGDIPECDAYAHKQDTPRVSLLSKKIDQTHFVLSTPSYAMGDKKEIATEVLAAILGGGMSSRLFTEIREKKGLAYYIKADSDSYKDIGSFYIRAGVSNKRALEAIKTSLKELQKMTKTLVPKDELQKAKEYVKGTTQLGIESTDMQADYMGYSTLVRGEKAGLAAFNKKVDAVTPSDIKRVAKELFTTNKLNLTIVGPQKSAAPFKKILKI